MPQLLLASASILVFVIRWDHPPMAAWQLMVWLPVGAHSHLSGAAFNLVYESALCEASADGAPVAN